MNDEKENGKKSWNKDKKQYGDKKPWDKDKKSGDKKPWDKDKKSYGDKKPWDKDKKPYGDKKPWDKDKKQYGDKKPWDKDKKQYGDKKPWDKDKKTEQIAEPSKPVKKVMLRQDLLKDETQEQSRTAATEVEPTGIAKSILYEDNHILVVVKPQNLPTQGDKTGDPCLLDELKEYLIKKYDKPGDAYLGLVHRLDRPTGGIMVFAKTSKAASRLSEQIREGDFEKRYAAVTAGKPNKTGKVEHYLIKDERNNYVSLAPSTLEGAKLAVSEVTIIDETYEKEKELPQPTDTENAEGTEIAAGTEKNDAAEKVDANNDSGAEKFEKKSLVSVKLLTGRTHQVRVQLKALGAPIVGDCKYAGERLIKSPHLALWAYKLCFTHPVSGDLMVFYAQPPQEFPWTEFDTSALVDTARPKQ